MIRRKVLHPPTSYTADTLARPHPQSFYTRLEALFTDDDWASWAAPLASAFSSTTGRPTDPVVYLKIFLISYLENIAYDTELAERIHDSIAIRAFLRYDLTEALPSHDAISRVRAAIADTGQVDAVLGQVVARCAGVGLIDGQRVAVDTTLIPANASLDSLVSVTTGEPVRAYLQAQKAAHPQAPVKVSNAEFRSTTDPDARLRVKTGHPRDLYYHATHVTDGRALIILAARADEADRGEPDVVRPAVRTAAHRLLQLRCHRGLLVGDAGFDDGAFHREVTLYGFTPLTNYLPEAGQKPAGYRQADFAYDPATDTYQCPHGHALAYVFTDPKEGRRRYRASATDCGACPGAAQCLRPQSAARWLARSPTRPEREQTIARCHTPRGRAALRARKAIVEPPFGHLKTYGGLRLINCRGRARAHVKVVLAAVAWNLIRLVQALTRPTRRPPAHPMCAQATVLAESGLAHPWNLQALDLPDRANIPINEQH